MEQGMATVGNVSCQMRNEVADMCDVYGGMKAWDGGFNGVAANNAEAFAI